ncbi:PREDICTED: charged multivesicular body protein 7-like [Branchiostoma belcheri]|uniref:Charged multivesicular body protein 7 n=1 Tax=Branchiostoma belcheri TaxID=7741 RepID=A0A6P5AIW8_BRABE|nr:PREDICTED: charged multivesicular body protein 7-like [Branchiostoma belcheri]
MLIAVSYLKYAAPDLSGCQPSLLSRNLRELVSKGQSSMQNGGKLNFDNRNFKIPAEYFPLTGPQHVQTMAGDADYLPECWEDDERMNFLFSAFPDNRELNPHHWDSKVQFWADLVVHSSRSMDEICLDCSTLPQRFKRSGKTPLGLPIVLNEMIRQGKIQKLSEFQSGVDAGWASWGFDLMVKRPLRWTFGTLTGRNHGNPEGTYLLLDLVKEKAEAVLTTHEKSVEFESTDHVVEYRTLLEQCRHCCKDQDTLDLALLHLRKLRKVCIFQSEEGEKLVKFASSAHKTVSPVTDVEVGILRLKKTEASLMQQVEKLQSDSDRCRTDAKVYLHKGLRNAAKNALRRKQHIQKIMEKREGSLETVHGLLRRIQDAESDKMVIDAYRAGVSAFKQTVDRTGLTPEAVDETMLDVQQVIETSNEISDSIAGGQADLSGLDLDMSGLEEELADLLAEETPSVTPGRTPSKNQPFIRGALSTPAAVTPQPLREETTSVPAVPTPTKRQLPVCGLGVSPGPVRVDLGPCPGMPSPGEQPSPVHFTPSTAADEDLERELEKLSLGEPSEPELNLPSVPASPVGGAVAAAAPVSQHQAAGRSDTARRLLLTE